MEKTGNIEEDLKKIGNMEEDLKKIGNMDLDLKNGKERRKTDVLERGYSLPNDNHCIQLHFIISSLCWQIDKRFGYLKNCQCIWHI